MEAEGSSVRIRATDRTARLGIVLEAGLTPSGLVCMRATVRNEDTVGPYTLDGLMLALPVPDTATEVLDLTGRRCRERAPQRRPSTHGTWLRETRSGRTGHDAALVLAAGTPGFGFGHGEVWGLHLAWSGTHRVLAERLPTGRPVIAAGELLLPGELVLGPGGDTRARGCTPPTATSGSTVCPLASTTTCAPAPGTRVVPARWCSTPGRPSTSTTTSTASPTWPTSVPTSAWNASSWTTAGSATAATTGQDSVTGTSTRPSGRTDSTPSSATSELLFSPESGRCR